MSNKRRSVQFFETAADAVKDVSNGSMVLLGGFGVCGIPEKLIQAMAESGAQDLTVVSNNSGQPNWGVGRLIRTGQVRSCYILSTITAQIVNF